MGKIEKTILFGGLNNQNPPAEVGIDNSIIAANVDFLDDKSFALRSGNADAVGSVATAVMDLFSVQNKTKIIFRRSTSLNRYDGANEVVITAALSASTSMVSHEVNDTIVISSGVDLLFLDSSFLEVTPVITAPLDGEGQFKALLSAFAAVNTVHCLGSYAGHLLLGTDDGVVFSDGYNIGQYDTRDWLLSVGFAVKHIGATNNGIWVAGDNDTVFLAGETIGSLEYKSRSDEGLIAMADTRRSEWGENEQEAPQFAALMTNGVSLLNDDGSMTDLSDQDYRPPLASGGVGIVRDINGARQALFSFTNNGDTSTFTYRAETLPSTITGLNVSGTGDMSDITAIAVNLKTGAISEYTDFSFLSMGHIGDNVYGSDHAGSKIKVLAGTTDSGVDIDASYLSGVTDLPNEGQYGSPADAFKQKTIVDIYLGMTVFVEAGTFWMRTDEITSRRYLYTGTSFTDLGIRNIRIKKIGKGIKGRYWQFGYENVSGSNFRIHSVLAAGARLKRRV